MSNLYNLIFSNNFNNINFNSEAAEAVATAEETETPETPAAEADGAESAKEQKAPAKKVVKRATPTKKTGNAETSVIEGQDFRKGDRPSRKGQNTRSRSHEEDEAEENVQLESNFKNALPEFDDHVFSKVVDYTLGYSALDHEKEVVKGIVVDINSKKGLVTVDVGLKSETPISISEFAVGGKNLEVGHEVSVYISSLDNKQGKVAISREKAVREESWIKIKQAYLNEENVEGIIFSRVKGGLSVDVAGVIAFLPGSQVDVRPVSDVRCLMGIPQQFKVVSLDDSTRSVIVSRKIILESERSEESEKFLGEVKEGDILEGNIKNITNYGAFVDLGSVDGLLHITDITWDRISHPSEVLSLGQKVKVKIIKYDRKIKRLSLGMKQLNNNPWAHLQDKYQVGSKVKGKVVSITDYGLFVSLEDKVEGLIHMSEVSWVKEETKNFKQFDVGSEVEAMVLSIDTDKHRIALGIKQLTDNPWKQFIDSHKPGDILEGEVKNIVEFGMFVGLDDKIDGLVHVSDLCWGSDWSEKIKDFKKGDKVTVMYLSGDTDKQRISLGIKQVTENPFEKFAAQLHLNAVVTCTVTKVKNDGVSIEMFDGAISSFIRKSELSRERVEQRPERFSVNDKIDAKITFYDPENNKIALSVKALEEEEHKKAISEYGSEDSGASLGSILGNAMSNEGEEAEKA